MFFSEALLAVIKQENPEVIIIGHTSLGKDLSPRIVSKLDSGLISDVTSIEEIDGNLVFTRPIYSGKAFERKVITDGLVFATIRQTISNHW
jgi:electron transfer flavoprotein alpha subunit